MRWRGLDRWEMVHCVQPVQSIRKYSATRQRLLPSLVRTDQRALGGKVQQHRMGKRQMVHLVQAVLGPQSRRRSRARAQRGQQSQR